MTLDFNHFLQKKYADLLQNSYIQMGTFENWRRQLSVDTLIAYGDEFAKKQAQEFVAGLPEELPPESHYDDESKLRYEGFNNCRSQTLEAWKQKGLI